jgi:hypothetical protein
MPLVGEKRCAWRVDQLGEPEAIDRQHDQMEHEDRPQAPLIGIHDEGDIAGYCDRAERGHSAGAERRQHKAGGNVAEEFMASHGDSRPFGGLKTGRCGCERMKRFGLVTNDSRVQDEHDE